MVGIIYKYISPSGKVYIGQTTNESRRRKTFFNLNKSYGGDKIDSARRKYGPENFRYEIIYKNKFKSTKEAQLKLDELEEYYIKLYNSYKLGYNMTYGGYTTTGFKFTEEQKKNMSQLRIGKKLRPRTEKEKEYHSNIMKEKWSTAEYRILHEKINSSIEHKLKVSESLKGENNGMYGKKHTLSAREKMSKSRYGENNIWYGRIKSQEYREKIKNSLKKYYEKHKVSNETKEKISQKVSTPVSQFTINGTFIQSFASATLASVALNIDSSCIVKVCKRKRKSAGGYLWKYTNSNESKITWEDAINSPDWLNISEIIKLTKRNRNVIYYHIKKHGVPFIINGRKRLIHKPTLLQIIKD